MHFYCQLNYEHIPYPSPTSPNGNLANNGCGVCCASMVVEHLLPHWKEIYRYYYDGGNMDMRDAGVYVREQNWEAASALWQKVFEAKKGKTKMYAAFNLALYYELKDDFVKAKEYLDEASRLAGEGSSSEALIRIYQLQLDEQAKKNLRLQMQMKRFL